MGFIIGNNIGAVEGGNPTGQVYSTKIIRTYSTSLRCSVARAISTNGAILGAFQTLDDGVITIPITTPFPNGTKPKHITIQRVQVSSNDAGLIFSGVGVLVTPNTISGLYNTSNFAVPTDLYCFAYEYKDAYTFKPYSSNTFYTNLYFTKEQVISKNNEDITQISIALYLGTAGFTSTVDRYVDISVTISFD